MRSRLTSRNGKIRRSRDPEGGYILITLMLMFALIAIAATALLPALVQQIKRDREQEMCRRGTQYMRAIQHYYKKFNRYPTKVEDLENTNNVRFLRRRYKDPLMKDAQGHDKDFKPLHMQDVMLNNGPVMGGAGGFGAGMAGGLGGLAAQAGGLPGQAGGLGGLTGQAGLQGLAAMQTAAAGSMMGGGGTTNLNQPSGSDSSGSSSSDSSSSSSSPSPNSGPGGSISASGSGLSGQVFGGGPILGVASTSKDKTIREYNKKNHYNDWYFIYDATSLQVGLLVGPWQPLTMTGTSNIGTPVGQMNQGSSGGTGQSQSGFGGGFGSQSGFGQSPGGFGQSLQSPPSQNNQQQN